MNASTESLLPTLFLSGGKSGGDSAPASPRSSGFFDEDLGRSVSPAPSNYPVYTRSRPTSFGSTLDESFAFQTFSYEEAAAERLLSTRDHLATTLARLQGFSDVREADGRIVDSAGVAAPVINDESTTRRIKKPGDAAILQDPSLDAVSAALEALQEDPVGVKEKLKGKGKSLTWSRAKRALTDLFPSRNEDAGIINRDVPRKTLPPLAPSPPTNIPIPSPAPDHIETSGSLFRFSARSRKGSMMSKVTARSRKPSVASKATARVIPPPITTPNATTTFTPQSPATTSSRMYHSKTDPTALPRNVEDSIFQRRYHPVRRSCSFSGYKTEGAQVLQWQAAEGEKPPTAGGESDNDDDSEPVDDSTLEAVGISARIGREWNYAV